MAKQTTIPKVDEDFMREMISQGFPRKKETSNDNDLLIIKEDEPSIEHPKPKETPTRKRNTQTDYRKTYFEKVDFS